MKVIKKGNSKIVKQNKIECDECGAVVLCYKKELTFVPDNRDGDFYWFNCPECGERKAIASCLIN